MDPIISPPTSTSTAISTAPPGVGAVGIIRSTPECSKNNGSNSNRSKTSRAHSGKKGSTTTSIPGGSGQQQMGQRGDHWSIHWLRGPVRTTPCAVWIGRILFLTVLGIVTVVLGCAAFHLLTDSEMNLADTQWASLAERALVEAAAIFHRRRYAGETMASMVSELHPNLVEWPFVEFLGFERLARGLLNTSSGIDMGFAPYVRPEQIPDFEAFAYETYYGKLGFSNTTTAVNSFGRGIWKQGPKTDEHPDGRYHDTTGETDYGSQYRILSPIFRTDEGSQRILLFNTHSGKFQGRGIDHMIDCSTRRKQAAERGEGVNLESNNCGSITDMFPSVKQNGRYGAALRLPIFPKNDPLDVVGFIPTLILLDEMLDNAFADEVSGVDAVFETENTAVTFTITNGIGRLIDEGDHHDPRYDRFRQTVLLTNSSFYMETSPTFRLSLYPNTRFYPTYETSNPVVATAGSVVIIFITSLAFFLYDFFVRREFNSKHQLLQARRQFMRFVSHEVRTPLNSVCMGLEIVQSELAKSLGFESALCVTACHDFAASDDKEVAISSIDDENGGGEKNMCEDYSTDASVPLVAAPDIESASVSRPKVMDWFQLTQEIQSSAQGAVDILNDIIFYDKIEQGTLKLVWEEVSVWDLVEKAILEFKLPAASKNIDIGLYFRSTVNDKESESATRARQLSQNIRRLTVCGDSIRLTQVLRNLMSNALKFSTQGGSILVEVTPTLDDDETNNNQVRGTQTVKLSNDTVINVVPKGCVKVVVKDSGAGMSKDQLSKLFNEGQQFNPNTLQAGQGSGLGLYIAKGIVQQHKGDLTAASDGLGLGTSFIMSLPLWQTVQADNETPELNMVSADGIARIESASSCCDNEALTSPTTSSLRLTTSSLRLLVVDDVKSNRKLLRRLLENEGHRVEDCEDGLKCVDMVIAAEKANIGFDCVLLDFEMPHCDGPSAAKEIRRLGYDVFIVGVTGNVLPSDVKYFTASGANDVLSKPVRLSDLDQLWMEYGIYEPYRKSEE